MALLRAVVLLTAGLGLTALATLFMAVFWSSLERRKEERWRSFQREWLPVLAEAAAGNSPGLPALGPGDWEYFLALWCHFQESLQGESRENLLSLGRALGLEREAKGMLASRDGFKRALAITALGYLREETEWGRIAEIAEENEGIEGYIAALALARIDPKRAAAVVVPVVARRSFWPQERVAALLKELRPENIGDLLVREIEKAPPESRPRLIRLVHFSPWEQAAGLVRRLLAEEEDPEILAASLVAVRQLGDVECGDLVRSLLGHPAWQVRVQAVNALAIMAKRQDLDALIRLLSDENWWVRYRSAQAIVWLPFLKREDVERILEGIGDRYGRESLERSIAEREARDPLWR
ncbi:MAG: HEAT repeat domain-containing protein [Thermacetogeniaceae bacterium]